MEQKSPLGTPWRDEITSDCSIMQHPRWCTLGKVTHITVRRSKVYRLQMRYPAKYLIWLNPDSRARPFVSPMKVRETFSRELLTEADVCFTDGQDTQPPPNCWGVRVVKREQMVEIWKESLPPALPETHLIPRLSPHLCFSDVFRFAFAQRNDVKLINHKRNLPWHHWEPDWHLKAFTSFLLSSKF